MSVSLINNQAQLIIEKEKQYNDYKNNLIIKGEQNHLYKIDKEDKRQFKENSIEIEKQKQELELMILKFLTNNN